MRGERAGVELGMGWGEEWWRSGGVRGGRGSFRFIIYIRNFLLRYESF